MQIRKVIPQLMNGAGDILHPGACSPLQIPAAQFSVILSVIQSMIQSVIERIKTSMRLKRHGRLAALASLVATVSLAVLPGVAQSQSRANEVRALWVVRNTLTSPEKIHQMVESAAQAGFNTLI